MKVEVKPCSSAADADWLKLRMTLWPDSTRWEHLAEMARQVADTDRYAQFLAYGESEIPLGFAEASIRSDYVNGTETSPVAFLEGIFVLKEYRRQGIAAKLVESVEDWGRAMQCSELASDAFIDNRVSHSMHESLGFRETERLVYFLKNLD